MIFRTIKPTRCTNFSILFWNETLHVWDSSSVHHQEFFTVHTAMVYVVQVCGQLASCLQTCTTYTVAVYAVLDYRLWTEELSETCRVSFQNKFEKLAHLVGCIVRNLTRCTVTWTSNCHDARSRERQKKVCMLYLQATCARRTRDVREPYVAPKLRCCQPWIIF